MSNHTISQPAARTFPVVDLVDAARAGRIRIPEFQRPLRWRWEDVRRLFDSILKGYPIGNLLLWKRQAPEGLVKLGALTIKARGFDDGWWVVDGQQRLTSLANALSDEGATDERFALAYDLRKQMFVRPDQDDDGCIVPLPVLFDLQRLILWFTKEHPEASEKLDEASRVTRAIREYQIPAYLVDQEDEEVLREIFTRMNDYGKRLYKADVFAALYPDKNEDDESFSSFQQIAESIHSGRQFGLIKDDTVLKALLARRGANTIRDIRNEFSPNRAREALDFKDESPRDAYRAGKQALLRAVRFLQDEANIPHVVFLPYSYLLVVLTRFFAHFPEPGPRNQVLLRRWFWRAALIGPSIIDANWNNAERALAECIKSNDETGSVQRLLDMIEHDIYLPRLTDFRPHWSEGRIILAALWALKPRSPINNEPYDRQQLADAIESDGSLRRVVLRIIRSEPQTHRHLAANRIFILEDDVQYNVSETLINSSSRLTGSKSLFMATHALDYDLLQKLSKGENAGFLEDRQRRIQQVVRDFVEIMTEPDLEDTPPLDSLDLDDLDEESDDTLA
jgi:hypothetical protein